MSAKQRRKRPLDKTLVVTRRRWWPIPPQSCSSPRTGQPYHEPLPVRNPPVHGPICHLDKARHQTSIRLYNGNTIYSYFQANRLNAAAGRPELAFTLEQGLAHGALSFSLYSHDEPCGITVGSTYTVMDSIVESMSNDASRPLSEILPSRSELSRFEQIITSHPPILESLIAQLPTESILNLYHTSSCLNSFLKKSPTSWRYVSWRLYQPALQSATPTNNGDRTNGGRQSSNYALDQLLIYVINPFSTRLTSLELDNTAVSGATLFQTVMVLRKDSLEHVSVRGCKNVSLKYHINPWLTMHAMALDRPGQDRAPGYEKLALKSLYTYRCRHHRRRPYLPNSLTRKESDSEPTHELVLTCHKLGIWTDTAWCTTPGARCFRRRGYVTMRVPQDPREVWVVYDRLWRSRNWLGPVPEQRSQSAANHGAASNSPTDTAAISMTKKRKRDGRVWEIEEEAVNGEPIGVSGDGKAIPTHLRSTHTQFVEDIYCDNCSDPILERCEQCSIMMHCSGCRKTLCPSCAFDRPYLRNRNAPAEERNKFWWAPGCAFSPCSMMDQDVPPPLPVGAPVPAPQNLPLPSIGFRWCCTEPVFSGGGGITLGTGTSRDADRIRAAPLRTGQGWEDEEFSHHHECSDDECQSGQIGSPLRRTNPANGPGGRWPNIGSLFQSEWPAPTDGSNVPRILCQDCHSSEQWKIKCKACSIALCLKHDVRERLKVRICGYKDLTVERAEFKQQQKARKILNTLRSCRKQGKLKLEEEQMSAEKEATPRDLGLPDVRPSPATALATQDYSLGPVSGTQTPQVTTSVTHPGLVSPGSILAFIAQHSTIALDLERPHSPGSQSTESASRSSSPSPSTHSLSGTPEPSNKARKAIAAEASRPQWAGCQSFFCATIRVPGDHRRRCVAIMRQCTDCKVHVCEQCVSGFQPSCPCKGCRVPSGEEASTDPLSEENLRFFCPNCRWKRMTSGKCKRKPMTTHIKGTGKRKQRQKSKLNQKRERRQYLRKPIDERQSHQPTSSNALTPGDSVEGVADLFRFFHVDDADETVGMPPSQSDPASGVAASSSNFPTLPGPSSSPSVALSMRNRRPDEMQQLADMDQMARDLIHRIQVLRQQFGEDSLAALALPNIRLEEPVVQLSMAPRPVMTTVTHASPASLVEPVEQVPEEDIQEGSRSGGGN